MAPAGAASLTWNGLTADWTVGTNWTPGGPPGITDTATVNAGNAQLNADTTILGLTQGGGTLSGTGTLTVTGPSTWTAGTQNGTGTTQYESTLGITGIGTKSITGGRTISLGGATTWSGNTGANNTISMANASFINNAGTFTDANAFGSTISGSGTFNNTGTFNKQSDTTTSMAVVFNNNGTVNVNAGLLLPSAGGTSTGVFNIASGATLEFRNGSHTLNNVTTSGAGTLQVSTDNVGADATVAINGGTLNAPLLLSGSTLTGTDQVFGGAATWTGGTLNGAAGTTTTFGSTLAISGTGTKVLSGGRAVNAGNTTWSGNSGANNTISMANASIFNNTGTFTDSNAFDSTITGSGVFNNNGTFSKQSATTTSIAVVFNNSATVNINAGTLLPGGGGTSSGVFNIADGAKLELRNGSHVLNDVTTSGAGLFQISTDNVGADASVALNGGTHTTAFLLSGSTLGGASHTLSGPATWTGGTINGTGAQSTTFGNSLAISGIGSKVLSGGRTVNAGDTTWSGNTGANNTISIATASVFNSNGTFTDSNAFDSSIAVGNGGGTFNNNGIFNKQSNTTTSLGVAFNNNGTVNVNAGTFLPGGGGTSSGVYNIADGARLEFRNGNHTLNGVTTAGLGLLQISTDNVGADAVVTLNGGTHTTSLLLSGSTLQGTDHAFQGVATWTGGAISGAASTTFNNDVTISGNGLKTIVGGRTVNLNQTTNWTGNTVNDNNAIRFWNGATLNNYGTFNDANAFNSFIEHNVGGPHNFNNIGTYNKQSNTITTVDLGVNFNNTGNLNINAGTMRVANAFDNQGTITVATGATFATTATNVDMQNHGVLQGTGTYDPAAGRAVINSGQVQPGTPTSVGELLIAGNYTQNTAGLIEFNLASLLNFDKMDVLGNLTLAGTVHVSSLGGYNPNDGDTFTIITFDDGVADVSDLLGTFSAVTWSGFNPGVAFTALYFDHSVVLSAVNEVPLPASAWLLATASASLVGWRLRRRR
ncbi:MAG: hypothetical protein JNK40_02835 [Chromatiales bacterium]|nr:hypothetical protein [Chromatiales bacterium]